MSSEPTTFAFELPDLGEGLTEAEFHQWYVKEGDEVTEDDPLCEVETDKAITEIPAPCTGTIIELGVSEGEVVSVGTTIAVFETENPPRSGTTNESAGSTQAPSSGTEPAAEQDQSAADQESPEPAGSTSNERIFAPPATRRYAREHNVDLHDVNGTGPGGRILRKDVESYLNTSGLAEGADPDPSPSQDDSTTEVVVRRPLRGLRRTIAENMARSKSSIPHVSSGFEANAGQLVSLKERLNEKFDVRITYTALLVKAVVPALKEYPLVNASIDMDAEEIIERRYYHIGIATHTEDGLLVPVIKHADSKSVIEIASELADLIEAARNRSLEPSQLQDSTFTITNTGSHTSHGTFGTPIINHPEAAILGVGQIENKPVAVNDTDIEVQKRVGLNLSFDHRLVDGVTAAEFMEYTIECIEDADTLIARL